MPRAIGRHVFEHHVGELSRCEPEAQSVDHQREGEPPRTSLHRQQGPDAEDADGLERHPYAHHGGGPEALRDPPRTAARDQGAHGERGEDGSRRERFVAVHGLDPEGKREEDPELPEAHDQRHHVAVAEAADGEQIDLEEHRLVAPGARPLPENQRQQNQQPRADADRNNRRAALVELQRPQGEVLDRLPPAVVLGLDEAVYDQAETAGRQHDAEDVETLDRRTLGLGDQAPHADPGNESYREVDEERPAPREVLGEEPSQQRAKRRGTAEHRAPQPEGDGSAPAGEQHVDHCDRGRHHHRRSDGLHRPETDEHLRPLR